MDRAVHTRTHTHTHTHTQTELPDTLHRFRFQKNAEDALLHHDILPPRKQSALDKVKAPENVTNVTFSDVRHPKTGALVKKLSGIGHVLSNVAQDYGGQNSMQDATCECSETSVRKYGLPCAHNIAHAEKAGMTVEAITPDGQGWIVLAFSERRRVRQ
jgi:hypothetical protein